MFLQSIVFRPDPVANPGSRFWPGHQVTWINFFFLKNQNDVVLVKKQKSTNFFFPCFFFNPARFQPRVGRVSYRPVGLDRVLKLCFKVLGLSHIIQENLIPIKKLFFFRFVVLLEKKIDFC